MYYRRKALLALLQEINAPVSRTDFQKLMFLVCMAQKKPAYDFVPYKFGCFSFQLEADKKTLTKYQLLEDSDAWEGSSGDEYIYKLTEEDQTVIKQVLAKYGKLSGKKLIRQVYVEYPYYAINSQILDQLLNEKERMAVENSRPKPKSAKLFTIGYEGKTLERYLCELLANDIKLLCDVRKNPMSMKYGFNKSQLKNATNALGIAYVHLPQLGIDSSARKGLETDAEFQKLFSTYKKRTLPAQKDAVLEITRLVKRYRRVALTCFEAHHEDCHRNCITEVIDDMGSFRHRIVHI